MPRLALALALAAVLACAHAPVPQGPPPLPAASVLAFAPGGERLALATASGELLVADVATGRVDARLARTAAPRELVWLPDGSRLVLVEDASVSLWTPGEPERTLRLGPAGAPFRVALAPDGRALAVSGLADGTVALVDARTGVQRSALRGHRQPASDVAWSADGRIATAARDRTLRVWDATTERPLEIVESEAGAPVSVAFGANGVLAWWARGTQRAELRGPGETPPRAVPVAAPIEDAALSADGELFAAATVGALTIWRTGATPTPADGGAIIAAGLAWSPGRRLTLRTGDGEVALFDPNLGGLVSLAGVPCHPPGWREVRAGSGTGLGAFAWAPGGEDVALSPAAGGVVVCRPRVPLRAPPRPAAPRR